MEEQSLRDAGFVGRILNSASTGYLSAIRRASEISEQKPRFIVFPETAEDISAAVLFAIHSGLRIAVKCGGHHYTTASSTMDGLQIDMGAMKSIAIDKASMAVTIGAGCLWGDVYPVVEKEGMAVVGGGSHVVGVGGHLTGGGYGPLTPIYGMACDNIISMTVVLADGRIVTAGESENEDLFWGIKGGSSSFGVVSQFVLKAHRSPGELFVRSFTFHGSALSSILPDYTAYVRKDVSPKPVLAFLNFVRAPTPKHTPAIILMVFGFGSEEEHKDLINCFLQHVKPLADQSAKFPSLVEFSHMLDELLLLGSPRKVCGGAPVTELWPGLAEDIWDRWLRYTDANPDAIDTKVFFEFHNSNRVSPENACVPVTVPKHSSIIGSEEHKDRSGDERAIAWTHEINSLVRSYQTKYGGQDLGVNGNTCAFNEKSEDVWLHNYPRMRKIKAKYDPNRVFDRYFPIEPDHPERKL